MIEKVLRSALGAIEQGESFALATVIESRGSSPGKPGHKMIIYADGRQEGTVGGGGLEHQVRDEAVKMISRGEGGMLHYTFDAPTTGEGMVCGGEATVAVEIVQPAARILICGGGHVGQALAAQFSALAYVHSVVDERAEIATEANFPGAGRITCETPPDWIRREGTAGYTHILVLTHDHLLDQKTLAAIAESTFEGYVGLIGSQRKWQKIKAALEKSGLSADWLNTIHCPIGLPIGGNTPAEIAVSIVAEIIQGIHKR